MANEKCKKCSSCPYVEIQNDVEPYEWGKYDEVQIYCKFKKEVIVKSLRPFQADVYSPDSNVCPLLCNEKGD